MRAVALLAALVLGLGAPVAAATPVGGRWLPPSGDSVIEIGRCGAAVCGRVLRVLKPIQGAAVDRNNPDPALRTRPIVGLPILTGFTDGGDVWRGRIYDPRNGRTYRSTLKRTADGALEVQGCVAIFCQTQRWTHAG